MYIVYRATGPSIEVNDPHRDAIDSFCRDHVTANHGVALDLHQVIVQRPPGVPATTPGPAPTVVLLGRWAWDEASGEPRFAAETAASPTP